MNFMKNKGYVALMSVMIISVALLALTFASNSSGFMSRFDILNSENKRISLGLAESCVNTALLKVAQMNYDVPYTGGETILVGANPCTIDSVAYATPFPFVPNKQIAIVKTHAQFKGAFSNMNITATVQDPNVAPIIRATLLVVTHLINDSGGTASAGDFQTQVTANNPTPAILFNGSEAGVPVTMDPTNPFTVTQTAVAGYTTGTSGCSGPILAGQTLVCTIVNYDTPTNATLTVIANVKNDDGGTKQPSDFSLSVSGGVGAVQSGVSKKVAPGPYGTYTVTGAAMPGYKPPAYGYQCDSGGVVESMSVGAYKTCIINFDDEPPPAPICAETAMMLDRSGSMFTDPAWIPDEKTAAKSLIDLYSGVTPNPKMAVGRFGDIATGVSAEIFSQLSTAYAAMKSAIDSGLPQNPLSYTNIADAISKGNDELNSVRHDPTKQKVLIIVSDGEPNRPTGSVNYSPTLNPSSVGTYDSWGVNTGPKTTAVSSNDGDTTYINTSIQAQTFGFGGASIPSGATNISVTLHAFAKEVSGSTGNIMLMEENGASQSMDGGHNLTSSYADYTNTFATDPSGGAWSAAEVNNWTTKFGVFNNSTGGTIPRVTQIYGVVSYALAANSGSHPPGSAVSPNQWTNPTNAFTSNNVYATDAINGHQQGYGNFGFSIPVGATIQGIQVTTEAKISGSVSPTNTATLYPQNDGNYSSWNGGATDVDETGTPSCSSGDYVSTGTNNARSSFTLNISSIPDGSTINNVAITASDRGDSSSGGTYRTFIRLNGNNTDAAASLTTTSTSGCTTRAAQTITPAATVKNSGTILEIGVIKINSGGSSNNTVRVGAVNAVVNYTPPSTGSLAVALSWNGGGSWTSVARNVNVTTSESVDSPSGNSSSDVWGRTWGSSEFNNGNFVLRVQNNSANGLTVSLDQVTANVFYTTPGNSGNLVATSVGNFTNWPPNTGTAITAVTVNDSDTTYISNSVASLQAETFAFTGASLPSNASNISVTLHAIAKETNGSSGNIALIADNGSSQNADGGHSLSSSYVDYTRTMNTNPFGGSWTPTIINNATVKFGVLDASTGGTIPRVTQLYLVVNYTVTTDPTTAAYAAADAAKKGPDGIAGNADDTDIFTIHFGDAAGRDLLAKLASGSTPNPPHENGSAFDQSALPAPGNSGYSSPSSSITPNQFSNPDSAFSSNDTYATDATNGHQQGYSNFGFIIPASATITGIQVTTEAKVSGGGGGAPINTATLYPQNNGNYISWSGDVTGVDETGTPVCNSGDYINTGTSNARSSFTLNLSSIPNGSTLNNVVITVGDRGDSSAGGTYRTFIRLNGANTDASGVAFTAAGSGGSTCTMHTQTITTASVIKNSGTTLEVGVIKINSGGSSNNAVRVGVINAVVNYTPSGSSGSIAVALSSDNGATWAPTTRNTALSSTESVASPSGNSSSDLWGRSWTSGDFANGKFALRVQNNSANGITVSLDQVRVNVYYSSIPENGDNDNFFISPSSSDMQGIFEFIGRQVCPALAATPPSPPTTGNIIIINHVINDNGGLKVSADFNISVTANNPSNNNFPGEEYPGTTITVDPTLSYSIDASTISGYSKVLGPGCSGTIVAGDTLTCIVTNDDPPPPAPPIVLPIPPPNIDINTWQENP